MKRIIQNLTQNLSSSASKLSVIKLTLSCMITSSTTGFSVPVPSSPPSTVFCFCCFSFCWSVFTFSRSFSNSERSWASWRERKKYRTELNLSLKLFQLRFSHTRTSVKNQPCPQLCSRRYKITKFCYWIQYGWRRRITVFLSALNSCSFFSSSSWTVSNSFSSLPSFNNAESFLERS